MREALLGILLLVPTVATAQVPHDALPGACSEVPGMDVANPPSGWEMGADSLMHTPQGDTARVYASSDVWICKSHYGQTYVSNIVRDEGIQVSGAIQQSLMRRISGDRTSPWWVGNFDHPARYAAILMHKRDGVKALEWAGLPTDSLWRYDP